MAKKVLKKFKIKITGYRTIYIHTSNYFGVEKCLYFYPYKNKKPTLTDDGDKYFSNPIGKKKNGVLVRQSFINRNSSIWLVTFRTTSNYTKTIIVHVKILV